MITKTNKNGVSIECQVTPDFLQIEYKANNTNFQHITVNGIDNVKNFLINIQDVVNKCNDLLSNPKLWH